MQPKQKLLKLQGMRLTDLSLLPACTELDYNLLTKYQLLQKHTKI